MTDRGVSEVLGFVLVFSLVTASVGVVYMVGFAGLEDTRDEQRIRNAERAMDVLADNMKDIHRDDAPNRATEIKLYDASLRLGDRTKVAVNITNNASGVAADWNNESIYPIEYVPQNSPTRLRYVNGAVFREDRNGARLLHRPPFVLHENASGVRTVVLSFVQTRPGSQTGSVAGRTTALVRTDGVTSEVMDARTDPDTEATGSRYNVEYYIETTETRAPLWEEYLDARFDEAFGVEPCTTSADVVECEFETDRLYVAATRVDVTIDS